MKYEEKTLERKHIYKGNIIEVESLKVSLPDGRESSRDIVLHPGASVVVPISGNGEIYMVTQYRKPIEKISLELPAGKLDKGEEPEACARRELKEETGLEAGNLKHLTSLHSTPGFCNEVLHLYAATELKEGEACADEDEFITCEKFPVSKLLDMILNHEVTDAKTIIGVLMADKILKGEIKI